MPYRNLTFPSEPFEYVETLGLLNVLQVYAAECRVQKLDRLDELVGIFCIQTYGEGIDAPQIFVDESFTLHDRDRSLWSDIPETQNPGTVGDDRNCVPLTRVVVHEVLILLYLPAGCSTAGCVPDIEIAEVPHSAAWGNFDLALIEPVQPGSNLERFPSTGEKPVNILFHWILSLRIHP